MAVGRLQDIWLDVPEELEDMDSLKNAFEEFFGVYWDDVMVGGNKPFVFHKDWEGYIAVKDIKPVFGMSIPDISGREDVEHVHNIIAGD